MFEEEKKPTPALYGFPIFGIVTKTVLMERSFA